MTLRSTIREIQTRDSDLDAIAANREKFLDDWKVDIDRLFSVIEDFLSDLVEDGTVVFKRSEINLKESELGEYSADQLSISIAKRKIIASPFARLISGGTGRVDLYRGNRPTDRDRIQIIRPTDSAGAEWSIEQRVSDERFALGSFGFAQIEALSLIGGKQRTYKPLNKGTLENALDFLLKL